MQLFPPQKEVIEQGYIDCNEHTLLNMATGSGKTYLSELAIGKVVESGYKAVFITPLRALAQQQCSKWKEIFAGYQIGVFTGETIGKSKTGSGYTKSQILIMTPERFDACLRNWRTHWTWIPDVSLVVVDEFHILGHAQRGPRLEGAITRMIRLNPFVRFIGLSATMPNYTELSEWLHGNAYHSDWRQIAIEKKIDRFSSAKDKPGIALERVKECVAHGGQSIVFCNSRSRVQQLTDFFNQNGIPTTCHHAGLLPEIRKNHEAGFSNGEYKAMVATSTVEMGLNFPARQVIIYDSYSYTGEGFAPLPVWSYIQRMGRAGRPGLDTAGECILLLPKWSGDAYKYLAEDCEPVHSQLINRQSLIEQILIDVYAGYSRNRTELCRGFLPITFFRKEHPDANINGIVNKLLVDDLLIEASENGSGDNPQEPRLKVGLLGRMAVKLMIAPETVSMIRNAKKRFSRLYLFDLLLLACMSKDCSPILQTDYEELDALCETVQPLPSILLDLSIEKIKGLCPDNTETLRILSAVKMAAVCHDLVEGIETAEIAQRFDVYESDIRMLKENVVRLLTCISAVSTAIDKSELSEEALSANKDDIYSLTNTSSMLTSMLQYELDCKLIALTQLSGVGGKTAKRLAAAGYSTLAKLKKASCDQLAAISGVGRKLAQSISKQLAAMDIRDLPIYSEDADVSIQSVREVKTSVDPYRLRRSLELTIRGKDGGCYFITGGSEDHVVMIKNGELCCDCLDFQKGHTQCKHVLCVMLSRGDSEITRMVKRIRENKSHSVREVLPTLWFSMQSVKAR